MQDTDREREYGLTVGYTAQLAREREGWLLVVVVGTCLRPRKRPCCGSLGRKERGGTRGGRGAQQRPGQEGDRSSWHTSGMRGPAGVEDWASIRIHPRGPVHTQTSVPIYFEHER